MYLYLNIVLLIRLLGTNNNVNSQICLFWKLIFFWDLWRYDSTYLQTFLSNLSKFSKVILYATLFSGAHNSWTDSVTFKTDRSPLCIIHIFFELLLLFWMIGVFDPFVSTNPLFWQNNVKNGVYPASIQSYWITVAILAGFNFAGYRVPGGLLERVQPHLPE